MPTATALNVSVTGMATQIEGPVIPAPAGRNQPPDFTKIYQVPARGNLGGGVRFALRRQGKWVKELSIWFAAGRLRGIRVTFDDGVSMQAGPLADAGPLTIGLNPGEQITNAVICSSNFGTGRAGRLELQTDSGKRYEVGFALPPPFGDPFTAYTDTTKGVLVGVYGGAGADLDNLGLYLALREEYQYQCENPVYTLDALKSVDSKIIELEEQVVENPASTALDKSLTFTHTCSSPKTWSPSQPFGLKAGLNTVIKTPIPMLVEGRGELTPETRMYTCGWGQAASDTRTDSWVIKVNAPPRSRVRVVARVTESTIEVPFQAKVLVSNSDLYTGEIPVDGMYRGVNVNRLSVTAEYAPA